MNTFQKNSFRNSSENKINNVSPNTIIHLNPSILIRQSKLKIFIAKRTPFNNICCRNIIQVRVILSQTSVNNLRDIISVYL